MGKNEKEYGDMVHDKVKMLISKEIRNYCR